jgi:CHAD domain-containing protein
MAKPLKVKHLDPDKRIAPCLKKILRTRLKEVFSYESAAVKRDDADAVHGMRVSVRRLKAVLAIFRGCFEKKPFKRQKAPLSELLSALGSVRDGDIFIDALVKYRNRAAEEDRPGLDTLIESEERERRKNRKRLKATVKRLKKQRFKKHFTRFLAASTSCTGAGSPLIQPKRSLRENGRTILPGLLDAFLAHKPDVVAHPAQQQKLHLMRIDGKRLRYGMEQFTDAYGAEYQHCLEEVKALLDVMGTIHDCDVNVPKIRAQIEALRARNKNFPVRTERMRVQGLEGSMRELKDQRSALFETMGETLRRWELEKFADALTHAMEA